MPRFPTRQADIRALAIAMMFGYWNHAADFPSADFPALSAALIGYNIARDAQAEAVAAAQIATE